MADANLASPPRSPDVEFTVFSAFGAVLGYLGAESATRLVFECLLWPQRFYSNFQLAAVPGIALLTPMGGPLHKAGLAVMDQLYAHGLLNGPYQGHMLGTAFFPQQDGSYTMIGPDGHTEPLRNFIWARAISRIRLPPIRTVLGYGSLDQAEKGSPLLVRARVTVSHLSITSASEDDKRSQLPFISEETDTPSLRVFLAIIVSEITAIVVAMGVFVAWKTPWALVWMAPLGIRMLSALLAQKREPLISTASSLSNDPDCDFQIHCPKSEGNFVLVTGPSALVLQFFRHYGHPKRNRFREVAQIIAIISFISFFPIILLISTVLMPLRVQYVWIAYQIYVVLVMHIARYSHIGNMSTTEANIAQAFSKQLCGHCMAGSEQECSILFGHSRDAPETLRVNLAITYHNRQQEGSESLQRLLERRHPPSQPVV